MKKNTSFRSPPRPFKCRIGLHSWYTDAALIHSAQICNHCGRAANPADARRLMDERRRIEWLPAGSDLGDMYLAAMGVRRPERVSVAVRAQFGDAVAREVNKTLKGGGRS